MTSMHKAGGAFGLAALLVACGGAKTPAPEEKPSYVIRSSKLPATYSEAMALNQDGNCVNYLQRVNDHGKSWEELDACLSARVNLASALCVAKLGYTNSAIEMLRVQLKRGLAPGGHAELARLEGGSRRPKVDQKEDTALVPTTRVRPAYPRKAVGYGVEGWIDAAFTVTAQGSVKDIVVVGAEPPGMFEDAAAEALSKWRYKPPTYNGKPVARACERVKLNFQFYSSY
ncbi:MAG: energy transducer TonB [Proteobacteria bacterium]|nr:energy transducer TonB [Pseudomonadota bacterium]